MMLMTLTLFCAVALAGEPDYVGTHKCKACHKKEEKGDQYGKWTEVPHSKAFETLKSEKAIKIAKEKGLTTAPHESGECLTCHTTGFGKGGYEIKDEAFFNPSDDDKDAKRDARRMENLRDVGCESCHGPGGDYAKKKVMAGIYEGELSAEDHKLLTIDEETCLTCHNEKSPTFKPFDYEERLKEIAHKFPAEMRKK
jgi:nitrate reductase cytochrome c-type subunit